MIITVKTVTVCKKLFYFNKTPKNQEKEVGINFRFIIEKCVPAIREILCS